MICRLISATLRLDCREIISAILIGSPPRVNRYHDSRDCFQSSNHAIDATGKMPECANPLYLQWIRDWWDSANSLNAKDRHTYKRAWESIKAHPSELSHPSEAIKLTGIGPNLVERLTERLETYCRDEGLPMPTKPTRSTF